MLEPPIGYSAALLRDLEDWRARFTELSVQISRLQKDRDETGKKILAAEVLLGDVMREDRSEAASIRTAVKELMKDGLVRKPREIRQELEAKGVDSKKISSHTGNFYTSLARLVSEGGLKKDERGRYWDPSCSAGTLDLGELLK